MAEREPVTAWATEGQALAGAQDQSTPDQPPSERLNDEHLNQAIFVRDDSDNQYVLPWALGKDWTQFKTFVEEIYVRKGGKDQLESIRDGGFDVKSARGDIILPSVWSAFTNPGDAVTISFWSLEHAHSETRKVREEDDKPPEGERRSSRGPESYIPTAVSWGWKDEEGLARQDSSKEADISRTPDLDNVVVIEEDRKRSGSLSSSQLTPSEPEDIERSEDTEDDEPPPPPEPIRVATPPTDQEGKPLSVAIKVGSGALKENLGKTSESNSDLSKLTHGRDVNMESLKITKTKVVTTESKTVLQVHILPGPENSELSPSVGTRWYHVHANELDWDQFQNTCLGIPVISERTRTLITKTLHKVEKENLEAFLGGMYIEPGTVLRGDDTSQSGSDSVIFSCLPHFDIGKPSKFTSGLRGRLHPSRTLMEAYYPSEPVRDRDEEQAFRKYGNGRVDGLIHVPSFWMLNIGSDVVVTCGYRPLSAELVKSIELHAEDLKLLSKSSEENTLTSIRLTVWDGRILLYSLNECQTFFEMERKLRELRFSPGVGGGFEQSLQLVRDLPEGPQIIKPAMWPSIIRQRNLIFIDLCVADRIKPKDLELGTAPQFPQTTIPAVHSETAIPPFFEWGYAEQCLQQVEKVIVSQSLDAYGTLGVVDDTFTSTKYYESLPEKTIKDLDPSLLLLTKNSAMPRVESSYQTHHQSVVERQSENIAKQAVKFVETVRATIELFVSDVDSTKMLRKLWGAMFDLAIISEKISKSGACQIDPNEYRDMKWTSPTTGSHVWWIRKDATRHHYFKTPLPESGEKFTKSLRTCQACRRRKHYPDPNDALQHLHQHQLKIKSEQHEFEAYPGPLPKEEEKLKDWIINEDQALLETNLAVAIALLDRADAKASDLYYSLKELVDGVTNEAGEMSKLYKFPHKLLETLRRLIIFYLAVERSLHFAEQSFHGNKIENIEDADDSLTVLQRFSEGVKVPLMQAREDLCDMARSSTPDDHWRRMPLGPQYICSWLMRRLIVKPLGNDMPVGDMYREYLSTLQFQVNHHPSKRLLRSINLLKEEMEALTEVNKWQTRLVTNYMCVLDDATYPTEILSRRIMYPYERLLLNSCLESLELARQDYQDMIKRCGPLSESTKQSAEINEEDHGKAILIFTVVTIIFLPLSFVTSYLGMNTSDIRDMDDKQSLFWEIALPLTTVVMGAMLLIAYNGDELRDRVSSLYRSLTGKQDQSVSAHGISVAQRKRAAKRSLESTSTLDPKGLADEAEYAMPKRERFEENYYSTSPTLSPDIVKADLTPEPMNYIDEAVTRPRLPEETQMFAAYLPNVDQPKMMRLGLSPPPPPPPRPGRQYNLTPNAFTPVSPGYDRKATNAPLRPSPGAVRFAAPTYVRVHRKYILPETLAHYAIPWEPDPVDSHYIIIKQNLDHWTTKELFQHTRDVREGRVGKNGYWEGGGPGREEYTWVNKKKRETPRKRYDGDEVAYRGERRKNDDEDEWYAGPGRRRR